MPEFFRIKPLLLSISLPAGSIDVLVEERDSVNVDVTPLGSTRQDREAAEGTTVDFGNDELVVAAPEGSTYLRSSSRLKIEVQAPIDSDIRINAASADVTCKGQYGSMNVSSASGNIDLEDATGDAKIQTASGDIKIHDVGGKLNAKSASGDISANVVAGSSTLQTASGEIEIQVAHSDIRAKSASGDLRFGLTRRGVIAANSTSGNVVIGVVPETGVWLELDSKSGHISNKLDSTESQPGSVDLAIKARTTSGDIEIASSRATTTD